MLNRSLRCCRQGLAVLATTIALVAAASAGHAEPTAAMLAEFDPPLGVYHYSLEWANSVVARADLRVSLDDDVYRVEVEGQTEGIARRLYQVRYRGEAAIDAEDMSAIESVIVRDRDGRIRETRTFFRPGEPVIVEETRRRPDKPTRQSVSEVEAGSGALDPFSLLFMARVVDWDVGVAERFEVVSGDDLWMVDLNCVDRVAIEVAGGEREAWIVIPTAEKVGEESDRPFVYEVALFVSADSARDVLKVRTRTRVGTARLRLERFSPEPTSTERKS
ncbi:MAG: DUF3108 domain-containing protein [Deltaproteobacteria bacterium]|nr:DUF3108 domain-containing protein [Deltaproteobacteria bacterium]MBW2393992.1 DUF3108 domain-containing protein [Deltaproteobacteria bacterium]